MRVIPRGAVQDMAQMSGGTYGKGGDVLDHYLWDTSEFANTTARPETRFFTKGQGQSFGYTAGSTKTLSETNLSDTGRLVAGQSFLVKAIALFANLNLLDAQDVEANQDADLLLNAYFTYLRASVFEFRFANQDFAWQAPGHIFLPSITVRAGQSMLTTIATARNAQVQVGEFNHYNWIGIKTPLVIGEMVSFSVNARTQVGDAAATIVNTASSNLFAAKSTFGVILKGTLTRSK